jgi:hypothetical protein
MLAISSTMDSYRPMKLSFLGPSMVLICFAGIATFSLCAQNQPTSDAAQTAIEQKDYPTAERLYRTMLAHSSTSPEILTNLGIVLELEGRSTEATSRSDRNLIRSPTPTSR